MSEIVEQIYHFTCATCKKESEVRCYSEKDYQDCLEIGDEMECFECLEKSLFSDDFPKLFGEMARLKG